MSFCKSLAYSRNLLSWRSHDSSGRISDGRKGRYRRVVARRVFLGWLIGISDHTKNVRLSLQATGSRTLPR